MKPRTGFAEGQRPIEFGAKHYFSWINEIIRENEKIIKKKQKKIKPCKYNSFSSLNGGLLWCANIKWYVLFINLLSLHAIRDKVKGWKRKWKKRKGERKKE